MRREKKYSRPVAVAGSGCLTGCAMLFGVGILVVVFFFAYSHVPQLERIPGTSAMVEFFGQTKPTATVTSVAARGTGTPGPDLAAAFTPVPQASPTPSLPPATPTASGVQMKVGNTAGSGVYLRRTTNMNDKLVVLPENTVVDVVGKDSTVSGIVWKNVKAPNGQVGWIPSQYLVAVK